MSSVAVTTAPAEAFEVIKGGAIPLSREQRRLVSMFIEYLYDLPEYSESTDWQNGRHNTINRIIYNAFSKRFGEAKNVDEYPPEVARDYRDLMRNARIRRNPVSERRKALLSMGRDKRRAKEALEWYMEARRDLGLHHDPFPELENMLAQGYSALPKED